MQDEMRRLLYLVCAVLVQIGIFSTRWNVVIGGQLFSKSLRGLTIYKLELFGIEGLLVASTMLIMPFVILYFLSRVIPVWMGAKPRGV